MLAVKAPLCTVVAVTFVTPVPAKSGLLLTAVCEITNPLAVMVAPPFEVMLPFPVAEVPVIEVVAESVTVGAEDEAMKYSGICKSFFINHQQR